MQQGVIDGATLCVHGSENIRVADLSIYPEEPTGNTQVIIINNLLLIVCSLLLMCCLLGMGIFGWS